MKVETQTLWEEFRKTGDVEIRNRLVEKYLYIVKYVADRLQQKLPKSIPEEDIRSAASYGLIRAVENFDHRRGTRFETYAITGVRGSGTVCVNGAAAHLAGPGETVIVASFCEVPESMVDNFLQNKQLHR